MLGSYSYYGEGSGLVAPVKLVAALLVARRRARVSRGWRLDPLITLVQPMILIEV